MWKLSTAFFPCSKEAFTRTPSPSAGSSITAVWHSTLLLCRVSLLGQQGMISGMVLTGPKLKPWLEGSHTTGMGVRGTLWDVLWNCPHCYCQLVLCLCCGQNCNNEVTGSIMNWMHWRGREVHCCFGTSWLNLAALAWPHLWPVTRATADPWA